MHREPPAVTVVPVGAPAPREWSAAVYLAGPTPTDPGRPSWRPAAVAALRRRWAGAGRLVVFVPEPPEGGGYPGYAEQVAWEDEAMRLSDVVAFHIPRALPHQPGLVSNVKWGAWFDSGRAVLGAPRDADRMEYLLHAAERTGVPVARTVGGTAAAALRMVGDGARRRDGERAVPLLLWRAPLFRRWYGARTGAGDRLLDARVEWYGRPGGPGPASWSMRVTVRPAGGATPVTARLVYPATDDVRPVVVHGPAAEGPEVALTRDVTPASVLGGPGTLSLPAVGPDADDTRVAHWVTEWTGAPVTPDRLVHHRARRPGPGPATTAPVAVRLTADEMRGLRAVAGSGESPLRIRPVRELLDARNADTVDWPTLGLVWRATAAPCG